jgi:hypothetical protein
MTDVSAESPVTAGTWPDGAYEAVDRWRQGHVLDGVPLVALGAADAPPFWAAGRPTGDDVAGLPVLAADPPYTAKAMVVSQGCDLVKQTFPFVTVVPVYEASQILSPDQQANARAGGTWHLVHLTSDWAASGFWVADLRLETAIDKSLLVPAVPAEAFADETGYAKLAERLAAGRLRAAVPDPCRLHVIQPLKEHLAGRVADGATPLAGVREVRVQYNHPTTPTAVTLFVVSEEGAQPDQQEWQAAFDVVHQAAAAAGIALAGPDISSLWDMSAADYINSAPVGEVDSS